MKKIYLAIPYTGMEEESYELATRITAKLMAEQLFNVFSPITHSHPLTKVPGVDVPGNWGFWKEIDIQYIDWCDEMYVIIPSGNYETVGKSTGVQAEISYCKLIGRPVKFITLNSIDKIVDTVLQPQTIKDGTN